MVVRFGLEGDGVQVVAGASYEALREYTIYKTILGCYVIIIMYYIHSWNPFGVVKTF